MSGLLLTLLSIPFFLWVCSRRAKEMDEHPNRFYPDRGCKAHVVFGVSYDDIIPELTCYCTQYDVNGKVVFQRNISHREFMKLQERYGQGGKLTTSETNQLKAVKARGEYVQF